MVVDDLAKQGTGDVEKCDIEDGGTDA